MKVRTRMMLFGIIAVLTSFGAAAMSQNAAIVNPLLIAYILTALGIIIHVGIIRNY